MWSSRINSTVYVMLLLATPTAPPTFAVDTGSLCSYSRYFSTLTNVLKKTGVILQALRSRKVILSEGRERQHHGEHRTLLS